MKASLGSRAPLLRGRFFILDFQKKIHICSWSEGRKKYSRYRKILVKKELAQSSWNPAQEVWEGHKRKEGKVSKRGQGKKGGANTTERFLPCSALLASFRSSHSLRTFRRSEQNWIGFFFFLNLLKAVLNYQTNECLKNFLDRRKFRDQLETFFYQKHFLIQKEQQNTYKTEQKVVVAQSQ